MIVKDIKNNTVCLIEENTGELTLKYKGLKAKVILPIGLPYKIERNTTTTIICRQSPTEYDIKSYINN